MPVSKTAAISHPLPRCAFARSTWLGAVEISRNRRLIRDPAAALRCAVEKHNRNQGSLLRAPRRHGSRRPASTRNEAPGMGGAYVLGGCNVPVREPPEFRTAGAELRELSTCSYGSIFVADKHADRPSDHADVGNAMPLRIRRDM